MPAESISARDKAKALKQVYEKHGELTPALVVKEANPKNRRGVAHGLASLLEWNDARAAEGFRIVQARKIIARAEPELIELGVLRIRAPHYVRDPSKSSREQGYVELASIKSREEHVSDVMREEIGRAVSSLERAYGIAMELERAADANRIQQALRALSPMVEEDAAA